MNPKLQKLRAELEKNTEKISKLQFRNAELKKQIAERILPLSGMFPNPIF